MNRPAAMLDTLRPYVPVVIRLTLGYLLIRHGIDKFDTGLGNVGDAFDGWGVPLPDVSATFVAVFEVVGGIALVLGLGTRLVALVMTGILLGAIVFVKMDLGVLGGAETDFAYIAALLSLAATGPGVFAVDRLIDVETSVDDEFAQERMRTTTNV